MTSSPLGCRAKYITPSAAEVFTSTDISILLPLSFIVSYSNRLPGTFPVNRQRYTIVNINGTRGYPYGTRTETESVIVQPVFFARYHRQRALAHRRFGDRLVRSERRHCNGRRFWRYGRRHVRFFQQRRFRFRYKQGNRCGIVTNLSR